jgi:pyridoxal phosphate enzyme (YggS family)
MAVNKEIYQKIVDDLSAKGVTLVAVSKLQPVQRIMQLYELGQRDFGENYVQELVDKRGQLPSDIRWHFIGHLQSNKVKHIAELVHLIHGVDSVSLLKEINKQAGKTGRIIDVLLQVHIAQEETKFGLNEEELKAIIDTQDTIGANVRIRGLMGMASFSDDLQKVRSEFRYLKTILDNTVKRSTPNATVLSMGMSNDYKIAMEEGATVVRIGSLLFGARQQAT